MELSKQRLEEIMNEYLDDTYTYSDLGEEKLIEEVFKGTKSLLLENTSDKVSTTMLLEHAKTLDEVPRDILEDFILYLKLTEVDSRLL
jgi:hypothetical protein